MNTPIQFPDQSSAGTNLFKSSCASTANPTNQYKIVANAISYLRDHVREQHQLATLAQHLGMSEFHLHRLFTQWAGVTPKKFLQFLTKEHALSLIKDSDTGGGQVAMPLPGPSIEESTFELGLSSPSRLHDLMILFVAMTPGEVKSGGAGVQIHYGFGDTPFGEALIAWTSKGICHLMFHDEQSLAFSAFCREWPNAKFSLDQSGTNHYLEKIFRQDFQPSSGLQASAKNPEPLRLLVKGSAFQLKVWEALIKIPPSKLISYSNLAEQIGMSGAQRAVGSAVARNNIAYLIPCHRVIRESGDFSHYRWGVERKMAMIGWEASRLQR